MIQKKLDKIAGHLLSIEFDYVTTEYIVTAIFPSHWQYVTPPEIEIQSDFNYDSIMLKIRSKKKVIDESIDFVVEMVKANLKIDHHNQKLKEKLENKKKKLLEEESEIAVESKKMASNVFNEIKDRLNKDKSIQDNNINDEPLPVEHEEGNNTESADIEFDREQDQ